ncbi:MAG: [protein-PII] uridylyltransferase [Desulfobulbaceae bacterium]|nr:[protein-PII] uridylyltransferase [Desulfobulbaceae bacterium]
MNIGLRAKRDALETLWRQGLSGHALLEKHTSLIDASLSDYFSTCKADTEKMALVALGGYGRRELFPYSDIDLMLLYKPTTEEQLNDVAEAVFYPLWDAGLEVGHGVRTPKTCIEEARKDFFLQVALLDARLVAGSAKLFDNLMKDYRNVFIEGHRKDFLKNMLSHRRKRQEIFGNHSYLLEPHIKESRGGFRDAQAMLWSAQVLFSLNSPRDLEAAGLLTSDELEAFEKAENHLIKIRNRLHYICTRKNDQLYFEHQEEMAKAFDYKDKKGILGVESFMRDVHQHLQIIALTSDLFFEHAKEVLGLTATDRQTKELEPGILLRQERIYIKNSSLPQSRPHLLMRAFTQVAKTGFPLHYRTKKLINSKLQLINNKTRRSKLMQRAFLETIQSPKAPLLALTDMMESGLLSAFIPEFKHLKSLCQHDIYHIFTVDRHLLQTVEEMNKLRRSEHNLFITVPSPALLFLAALLHDIGKGYDKNHSEYGAELIEKIGERLGLPENDIDCLVFLVREHLYLSEIALRRDLEDETLILRCSRHVKNLDRLTMLYLLAIADARATGPSAWSDWKAALLQELYLKIVNVLNRGDLTLPDPVKEIQWMKERISELLGDNRPVSLKILPDDYLIGFTPEEVAKHINLHNELKNLEVIIRPDREAGHWSLLIMTRDRPGLLCKICGVLALHNLKVLAAQIYTWEDGTVVDTLNVSSTLDSDFEDQNWQQLEEDLGKAIHFRLGLTYRLSQKLPSIGMSTPQVGHQPEAKVIIDTKASDQYTVIEVFAENRTGLLYDITRTMSEFGINTFRAKIGTKGDQSVDVFYVLDHEGHQIEDTAFQKEIKNGLLHATT